MRLVRYAADGWGPMIHFGKLGMGVAIVNACCNIPTALVAIPLPELPALVYHVVERRNGWMRPAAGQLKQALLTQGQSWQAGR